jgi:glycosyltransferase involved in cell wall biosynthesis
VDESRRISITHISTVHPRDDIRIFQKQCRSLIECNGADVTLIVADGLGDASVEGVSIIDVGGPWGNRFIRVVRGNIAVWGILRRSRPRISHFHDPELLFVAIALHLLGQVVVYDMHENLPKDVLAKAWVPRPLRSLMSMLSAIFQSIVLRWVPTVFAELSYQRDFASIKRWVVVQNFPIIGEMNEITRARRPVFTVGYAGGVSVDRGAERTLHAVQQVRQEGFNIELLMVGPVRDNLTERPEWKAAVADGWLHSTGMVSPQEAWALISTCHVGISLLDPLPNYIDSYPTKLFEYMVLGLPVIVSDFPLWREVVQSAECGRCSDPFDSKMLVEHIQWMLTHPHECGRMGERGRLAACKRYAWANEFAKLLNFYRSLLDLP